MTPCDGTFVIGTAGHVDHGKTALVRALTGVDTDRLPAEKARGISIELGFAPITLPGLGTGGVIDVPGHERLVRTMIRGAAAIDVALLVVAATEGVRPQTREHVIICALLGVGGLVVALTHADRVDEETLGLARLDVADLLAGTPFAGAAVIPCAAPVGRGVEDVRTALADTIRAKPPPRVAGPAYLPIDRVFTKPGFGTIVTGTLLRGGLAPGEEVDLFTEGGIIGAKIRGLQAHGATIDGACTKGRLAVSLGGLDQIPRGTRAIGARGSLRPTTRLVAALSPAFALARGSSPVRSRGRASLHLGPFACAATFTLLDEDTGHPGGARAFLTTERPLLAFAGDRFVLRRETARGPETFAGGQVLDPHPTQSRRRTRRDPRPIRPNEPTIDRVRRIVDEAGAKGCALRDLEARLVPGEDPHAALPRVAALLPGEPAAWVGLVALAEVEEALLARLAELHRLHPALAGHAIADVSSHGPVERGAPRTAALALSRQIERGAIERRDGLLATARHLTTAHAEASLAALEAVYREAGLRPPADDEAVRRLPTPVASPGDLFVELRRRRILLRVPPFHVHALATDALIARVHTFFETNATLGAGDLKALGGGLSRKYAIPLLEWLDARGVTRRQGEHHVSARPRR